MALYEVTPKGGAPRLIEAHTKQGARSFAAKDAIEVVRCTAMRAHTLSARGVKVEDATKTEEGSE